MQTATDWLHYHPCPGTQDNIHRAFVAGAQWADSHPASPWVNVKERLPEEGQIVIMANQYGVRMITEYGENVLTKIANNVHPTHWMPIPELPKGGEK